MSARLLPAATPPVEPDAPGGPELRLELGRRQGQLAEAYPPALAAAARRFPGQIEEGPGPGLELIARCLAACTGPASRPNPFQELVTGLLPGAAAEVRAAVLTGLRPQLVTAFAYAVPSDAALAAIADLARTDAATDQLVEVGAGGGYWARCLHHLGVRVQAFDHLAPAAQRRKGGSLVRHHPVLLGGPVQALAACPGAPTLLLCWPPGILNRAEANAGAAPRFSDMGVVALERFRGPHLVFVGAHTRSFGSPAFFARLERQFSLIGELPLPNLGSWRDGVYLYRRR